ncbi:MAG: hypothetical protein GPJ54_07305 [Candidatus Heimdallarchaeota archaeon]|nr:hypothetical protein [Candidatus Heimdallarchaeota archaeon]
MHTVSTISSVLSPVELSKYIESNYKLGTPIDCKLLKKGFNDHYLIIARSKKYVLRIYSTISCWDRTREEMEFEVEFMLYLSKNGISVSTPIKNKEGKIIGTIKTAEGERNLFLMDHLLYRKYEMDEALAMNAGEHMANFHEISGNFESDKSRLKIDIDYLINNPLKTILAYQP